jgi:hypothetical protein
LISNSPYYDETTAQPGLAPLRRVKLQRYDATNTAQDIFNGYIINYDYNFALGGLDTVTVFCADQFYLLAQTVMDEFNVSEELTSTRLEAVLDLPEVAFPIAQRNIDYRHTNTWRRVSFHSASGHKCFTVLFRN